MGTYAGRLPVGSWHTPWLGERGSSRPKVNESARTRCSSFEAIGAEASDPILQEPGDHKASADPYQKPFALEVTGCRSITTRPIAWSWTSRIVNSTPS